MTETASISSTVYLQKEAKMLEKLSPQLRHAIIALLGAVFTVVVSYIHTLHLSAPVEALVGTAIASLALIFTPLTNQYGVAELNPDNTLKK
jgi:hypothetical protein